MDTESDIRVVTYSDALLEFDLSLQLLYIADLNDVIANTN